MQNGKLHFFAFVKEFMLSKGWDVEKLILVEESSPDVNRILRIRLYRNFAFWFGNRWCRTQLPSCVTEGIRKKNPPGTSMSMVCNNKNILMAHLRDSALTNILDEEVDSVCAGG